MANSKATLIERIKINEDLGIFKFETDIPLDFIPGQYNALGIKLGETDKIIRRPYSIASTPGKNEVEYLIRYVRNGGKREDGKGKMTTELFELTDEKLKKLHFEISHPEKGKLFLDEKDKRNVILVGTGTGLAPFMSKLRSKSGEDLLKYTLIHGVANCQDLAYFDELTDLVNNNGLRYLHVKSRKKCDGEEDETNYVGQLFFNRRQGKTGRINLEEINEAIDKNRLDNSEIEKIFGRKLTPEKDAIMLCGNPDMIANMTRLIESRGFKDGEDVISEKYWPAKKGNYKT